nr:uncharacterized protein LOC127310016 [Lolium perenne]
MWRPQAQALILFSDDPPTALLPLPPTEAQIEGEVEEEKLEHGSSTGATGQRHGRARQGSGTAHGQGSGTAAAGAGQGAGQRQGTARQRQGQSRGQGTARQRQGQGSGTAAARQRQGQGTCGMGVGVCGISSNTLRVVSTSRRVRLGVIGAGVCERRGTAGRGEAASGHGGAW